MAAEVHRNHHAGAHQTTGTGTHNGSIAATDGLPDHSAGYGTDAGAQDGVKLVSLRQ